MSRGWIQTYTGKQYWPMEPRTADVDITDITHALSNICRYTGHVDKFYSVAQHSVIVAEELQKLGPWSIALQGLLHDAAEAYICDLARPIKVEFDLYNEIEEKNLRTILAALDVPYPLFQAVKEMDDTILMTEARDLLGPPPAPWGIKAKPIDRTIVPMTPKEAKEAFQAKYKELTTP